METWPLGSASPGQAPKVGLAVPSNPEGLEDRLAPAASVAYSTTGVLTVTIPATDPSATSLGVSTSGSILTFNFFSFDSFTAPAPGTLLAPYVMLPNSQTLVFNPAPGTATNPVSPISPSTTEVNIVVAATGATVTLNPILSGFTLPTTNSPNLNKFSINATGSGDKVVLNTLSIGGSLGVTVPGDGSITEAAGNSITTTSGTSGVTLVGGNASISGTVNAGSGNISITSNPGTVFIGGTLTNTLTAGNINLTGGNVTVTGALTAGGGNITINSSAGTVSINNTLTASSGNITINSNSGAVGIGDTLTAAAISVTGANVAIVSAFNAGSGNISITGTGTGNGSNDGVTSSMPA